MPPIPYANETGVFSKLYENTHTPPHSVVTPTDTTLKDDTVDNQKDKPWWAAYKDARKQEIQHTSATFGSATVDPRFAGIGGLAKLGDILSSKDVIHDNGQSAKDISILKQKHADGDDKASLPANGDDEEESANEIIADRIKRAAVSWGSHKSQEWQQGT